MSTLTVTVRNLTLRDSMYEFLQRNYRAWNEVLSDEADAMFYGPFIDEDLSTKGSCRIGFEYDASCELSEREYHTALLRWVALKTGKRRSKFRANELKQSVPFLTYDFDKTPLFFVGDWTSDIVDGPLIDHLGMRIDDTIVREIAWMCLPQDVFTRVSLTHWGRSPYEVENAILSEGIETAHEFVSVIKSQIARLDSLWEGR